MGCGNTKPVTKSTLTKIEKFKATDGFFPTKISSVSKSSVVILDTVYLIGGKHLLQYEIKTNKISKVEKTPNFEIPHQTESEYLISCKKIVLVGGTINGKTVNKCYMLTPPDFDKAVELPAYPKPVKYATLCEVNKVLYVIGGQTDCEAGDKTEGCLKDVYALRVNDGNFSSQWEEVCQLDMPRRSANVAVTEGKIFVFGGYNGKGLRTTQFECIDLVTKKVEVMKYRLPLGVEGARLCWHGEDILMVGGKRIGEEIDYNVLLLDLEKKSIISMRDLVKPRDFPLIIPTAIDEVIVLGGGVEKTAERRRWNPILGDYVFTPCVVEGMELIEDPTAYDSALPTFVNNNPDNDAMPTLEPEHRVIFGNEIDCFLIDFPPSMVPCFYQSPMRLQQKTGQVSVRSSKNTIYLCGGTDTTRSKFSMKSYKFVLEPQSQEKIKVTELARLNTARYVHTLIHLGDDFYAIGGKVKGSGGTVATNSVEKLSKDKETASHWENVAPMNEPRFGHISWTSGNKIFTTGGTTVDAGKPLKSTEVYDASNNTWTAHDFKFEPELSGSTIHLTDSHVYIFGGQDNRDIPQRTIFKIDRHNPTKMEKVADMRTERVDCFVMDFGNMIIVIGGSDQPLMEAFNQDLSPISGTDAKSNSFFAQLECYTSDLSLRNCSCG